VVKYIANPLDGNMSSISLPIKIEFAISLIIRYHYILWPSHFQTVNSKVNIPYIIIDLDLVLRTLRPKASGYEFFRSGKVKAADRNLQFVT